MIPKRYNWKNLQRAIRNPERFKLEIIRSAIQTNKRYYRRYGRSGNVEIMDEEWDNFIILDGCRYDLFADVARLPGQLEKRYSKGSDSWEFMEANFVGRELHDTVYVTSNPHVGQIPEGTFHRVISLLDDHWDETHRTVMPEVVTDAILSAREEYPDKRIIGHYMQPHFPFIGETGRRLEHMGLEWHLDEGEQITNANPWFDLVYSDVPVETILKAYRENLELVLPDVETLLDELTGRTIVSADHGNLIGERTWPVPIKTFGHPRGLHKSELLAVPWLVVDGEPHEHVAEPPVERSAADEDVIQDRLTDLGYMS